MSEFEVSVIDRSIERQFKAINAIHQQIVGLNELIIDWGHNDPDVIGNILVGIETSLSARLSNLEDLFLQKTGAQFKEGFDYEVMP
jgi:hypothetical protein